MLVDDFLGELVQGSFACRCAGEACYAVMGEVSGPLIIFRPCDHSAIAARADAIAGQAPRHVTNRNEPAVFVNGDDGHPIPPTIEKRVERDVQNARFFYRLSH
ncbi:hypothetical protein BOSE62_140053 [Bosea sp. 62]|nr:hypothetical protein BOSE7B_150053 [Bosea sp. 7B]CAD5271533.1 hypothetical protein BOSE21B_20014 [Bosea sp. 21B]CAD5273696.1 hypothetical protein BOSE46_20312 [Bosea sp. 46]VVT56187.1 hypothetical protein BOS5A_140015 [Bosea sp. EC-HK365B]VXB63589.1 hypothetical protein BOSE62_140053 [Bosea sp. 62]VXC06523.1 hypothetical protein BOSE29B_20013 [Bosea sp. 29B]VXC29303.1 hypothetical protein BOSE127_180053 [Bosea sp. 127]VXC61026.1 hypothetical protein BOSE125_30328 [Bosea sp. 125]